MSAIEISTLQEIIFQLFSFTITFSMTFSKLPGLINTPLIVKVHIALDRQPGVASATIPRIKPEILPSGVTFVNFSDLQTLAKYPFY